MLITLDDAGWVGVALGFAGLARQSFDAVSVLTAVITKNEGRKSGGGADDQIVRRGAYTRIRYTLLSALAVLTRGGARFT